MMISDDYNLLVKSCIEKAIKTKQAILVSDKYTKEYFEETVENMGFEKKDIDIITLEEINQKEQLYCIIFAPEKMIANYFNIHSQDVFYDIG